MRNIKKMLVLSLFAIAIIGIIAPCSATICKDKVYTVESKEKTVQKYKVTWNANGGKIGSKKTVSTSVQKGSKVGTLKKATRSGYALKGWYTKKTGGTKITKNTKPKKNTSYYAQWKKTTTKKNSVVGRWKENSHGLIEYTFKSDGTYTGKEGSDKTKGTYHVSSNKLVIDEKYHGADGEWILLGDVLSYTIVDNNKFTSTSFGTFKRV